MRNTLLLASLLFAACAQPLTPEIDGGTYSVTRAERLEENPNIMVYGEIYSDGVAADERNFDLALGATYPQTVMVGVAPAYITRGCQNGIRWGKERFLAITQVMGDAATLSIVDGKLRTELKHEGVVSAVVTGEIYDVECERDEGTLTTVPSRHLMAIRVSGISKLAVVHDEHNSACRADVLVVPANEAQSFPRLMTFNTEGAQFFPINAPRPAAITLTTSAPLTLEEGVNVWLTLPRGKATVEVDTNVPVDGLREIVAVEPSQVTSASVDLGIERSFSKGSQWVEYVEDKAYQLFDLQLGHYLALRTRYIETTEGALCAQPGNDWFEASTETPRICESTGGDASLGVVAKITSYGECKATVKLRDTNLSWNARFSTTN